MQPKILLANPRGFCAGVDRAITIVERALECFPHPIYVRHEVVHNRFVVENLKQRGAIFIEDLDEVPEGQILIFSAHGVSQEIRIQANERNLTIFDATCPLVTKVHMEVARASRNHEEVILIGHNGHPEVIGTMGQYLSKEGGIYLVEDESDIANLQIKNQNHLHYVSQTTLSIDETALIIEKLKETFPHIKGPRKNDICYATQNRQDAVKQLASQVDLMIVVGSHNSSNSNRLKELSEKLSRTTFLVDTPEEIDPVWFQLTSKIGVTAGASAPKELVDLIINQIIKFTSATVEEMKGCEENMVFEIPKALQKDQIIPVDNLIIKS